jgi:hypothetical protein
MAKAPAAQPPQQDTQAPKMPGAPEMQMIRDLVETIAQNLNDADYMVDTELLNNCLCSSMFQAVGIGLILSNEGELSLITPFGLIQGFGTLSDSDVVDKLFDELEQFLSQFCQTAPIDDNDLSSFEIGDKTTGYWIISCGDMRISRSPRLLAERECVNPLQLESEWEKMVR